MAPPGVTRGCAQIDQSIHLAIERRKWQPTPEFLSGKFQGQRSLAGYSPQGHKESDTTEHTLSDVEHCIMCLLVIPVFGEISFQIFCLVKRLELFVFVIVLWFFGLELFCLIGSGFLPASSGRRSEATSVLPRIQLSWSPSADLSCQL